MSRSKTKGILAFLAFIATVPLANWMIGNVGTVCLPRGPCLIPVGLGIMAPSGVLVVGAAFVLRDILHRHLGARYAVVAILIGGVMSAAVAPPALILASVASFMIAEIADLCVYTPLQRRGFIVAVVVSSIIGLIIDSILFLWLAFGSLDLLVGQIVGKTWAMTVSVIVLGILHQIQIRRERAKA